AIPADKKTARKSGPAALVIIVAILFAVGFALFTFTKNADRNPVAIAGSAAMTNAVPETKTPPAPGTPVLTVSGYVIPRERIEISPKFQGTVKWIGVKKGDIVKKDDVLVTLDDSEYQARVLEAIGRVQMAEANTRNAEASLRRLEALMSNNVESASAFEEAQRARDASVAEVTVARGQLALVKTWLAWCTITAPIDGTILEKLVNPNELVVPQSFGGGRGPSTAFLAMADLTDLQVEIDLNEVDTPKVHMNQKCRVNPEAYPDKSYTGFVAELAPEANRAKGTLQVKVQIENPDRFLTPELTAKVDFLAD
ncbi:MAG TPA: efflux RND transporter periplasmic adaptor subunit, partial [Kiritimatiellia bacterium]